MLNWLTFCFVKCQISKYKKEFFSKNNNKTMTLNKEICE